MRNEMGKKEQKRLFNLGTERWQLTKQPAEHLTRSSGSSLNTTWRIHEEPSIHSRPLHIQIGRETKTKADHMEIRQAYINMESLLCIDMLEENTSGRQIDILGWMDRSWSLYVCMLGSLHATHSIQPRHGSGYMCGIQGARHAADDRLIRIDRIQRRK